MTFTGVVLNYPPNDIAVIQPARSLSFLVCTCVNSTGLVWIPSDGVDEIALAATLSERGANFFDLASQKDCHPDSVQDTHQCLPSSLKPHTKSNAPSLLRPLLLSLLLTILSRHGR